MKQKTVYIKGDVVDSVLENQSYVDLYESCTVRVNDVFVYAYYVLVCSLF